MAPEAANRERGGPGAAPGAPLERGISALVLLAFALTLVWNLAGRLDARRGGWDETTHLELPAARMLVALEEGRPGLALDALLDCHQYPFVAPVYLAAVQGLFGLSEEVGRRAVLALWLATLAGLALLGFELRRSLRPASEARGAGYVALLGPAILAFASPLGMRFSGTLFLEVPVACASTWTLVAWLRRRARPSFSREVWAGAWIALTFFTKFNYGLLLAAGLALDFAVEGLVRARFAGGRGPATNGPGARAWWRTLRALALVPTLVALWWFVLPHLWPGPEGLARAAQHRASFLSYLTDARGGGAVPWARRLVDWAGGVAPNPVLLGLTLVAALASLARATRPALRTLWCVLLATGPPVWFHPFHLDRLLLPGAIPLWLLAGAGAYLFALRFDLWRDARSALAFSILVVVLGFLSAAFPLARLAESAGLFSPEPQLRSYQESVLRDLRWGGSIPSAGLPRAEHAQLLDWIEAELAPGERFAWLGLTSELSPASIQLDLLARSGDRRRFLRDAARQVDVTPVPGMPDPGWSVERLGRFLEPFDVVFMTHPPDLKGRAAARYLEDRYQRPLIDELHYGVRQVGTLDIASPPGPPVRASLYALRKP